VEIRVVEPQSKGGKIAFGIKFGDGMAAMVARLPQMWANMLAKHTPEEAREIVQETREEERDPREKQILRAALIAAYENMERYIAVGREAPDDVRITMNQQILVHFLADPDVQHEIAMREAGGFHGLIQIPESVNDAPRIGFGNPDPPAVNITGPTLDGGHANRRRLSRRRRAR
jgi:hypothetical protein